MASLIEFGRPRWTESTGCHEQTPFRLASPAGAAVAPLPALADAKFEAFIQNTLWPRAKAAGIPRALFDAGLRGHHRA